MKTNVRKKRTLLKHNIVSYSFLLPWFFFLFVFTLFPFLYGIVISLFDFTLKSHEFIGFGNFKTLFASDAFWSSLLTTLKFVAIIIPGTLLVSLWIAYSMRNASPGFQTFVKIVFYLTSIVSQVALVMVWKWMFNPSYGLYASICRLFGIETADLLGNPVYSIPLLSVLVLGFTISQPIVLFSSAIDAVPASFVEAAQLDGASDRTCFRKVTLPLIAPTIIFVLITTTINNLQVFLVPYLMTGGGPSGKTTPVLLLIYRNAFEYGNFGYASALGVVLFSVIGIFVFIQFKLSHYDEEV